MLLLSLSLGALAQQPMTFRYFYDDTGQLIKVIDSTGIVIEYVYDAVGNMLEIKRSTVAAGSLSIFSFTPQLGTTGTTITIQGQGFSTTPSANQVRFGGVVATVLSASATQLVVQIPAGALSGPLSVTVGTQTASSSTSFGVVPVPVITSIQPRVGLAGTTLANFQVNGHNLGGSTFAFLPLLQPMAAAASGIVVNPAGTQATMTLAIRPNIGQPFVIAATNSFGSSDPFPSAEKIFTILNLAPNSDPDQDGLTSADEVARGTDPAKFDTDGDGFGDGLEVALGSDPLNPASVPNLTSGPKESVGLYVSILNGIPPVILPTTTSREAIGLYVSVLNGIPPLPLPTTSVWESIGPLVSVFNGSVIPAATMLEQSLGAARLNQVVGRMISRMRTGTAEDYGPDSDGDGIPDQLEQLVGTDPGTADTDFEGYPDGLEIVLGSNPLDPLSVPLIQRTPEVFGPMISVQNEGGRIASAGEDFRKRSP